MFKKLLAAVGIGGATIETTLDQDEVEIGGTLTGTIRIQGGSLAQTIAEVTVELITVMHREEDGHSRRQVVPIGRSPVAGPLEVAPGEVVEVGFSVGIPPATPVSASEATAVWLRSALDIAMVADPADQDAITILPPPVMRDVFAVMEEDLDLRLAQSDLEPVRGWGGGLPFVQEWEFRPNRRGTGLDEVELVFHPTETGYDLMIQIDRAARGLGGLLREASGFDESWRRLRLGGGLEGPGRAAIAAALREALR
ncbi:MAG TPA: sporulation protein [Alphaproteobacteria bacterium]|nr:sporulation protein [Alphaproteobacteria bacterium]